MLKGTYKYLKLQFGVYMLTFCMKFLRHLLDVMYHRQQNNLYPFWGGRFCKENSLLYLDLCYVIPAYNELKTFPLL